MNNIIALGDSIMKGVVTAPNADGSFSNKYKVSDRGFISQCEMLWGQQVTNLARFGNTILGGLKCLSRHSNAVKAHDVVVLEFGGNDCNFDWQAVANAPEAEHLPCTSLSTFRQCYMQLLERLTSLGAKPVMLSLPALDSQQFFRYVSRGLCGENIFRWLGYDVNTINNWHEQYNIEIFKIGAAANVPVIDISSIFLNKRNLADYYCEDGMHPNEAGHTLIAEAVATYSLWGSSIK